MSLQHVSQVAICVADHRRSTDFYRRVLGLDHVFGTTSFRGEKAEQVQGLADAASTVRWLVDDRDCFQLEIFQFETPQSHPLRVDHGVTDIGYNRIIVAVRSVADTLALASALGGVVEPMTRSGATPGAVHALLRDPDGIILELIEWPESVSDRRSARIMGVGVTTADPGLAVRDMCEGFGFSRCEDPFEHLRYWSEEGDLIAHQALRLGDMFLLVSSYRDARPRPTGYRLCDIGIMNFALGFGSVEELIACYERANAMGMRSTGPLLREGDEACVVYHNDRQGFSVEMLYLARKHYGLFGFSRPSFKDRVVNFLAEAKAGWEYRRRPGSQP